MTTAETTSGHRTHDGLRIALGVGGLIAFVLGLFVIFAPGASAAVALTITAVLLAVYAIITGIVYLGSSIFSRTLGGWARTGYILLGLLYIIGGVIMLTNLMATGALLALFITITIGVLWLFEGIMAFSLAGKSESKTWAIIMGIVSVLAGLVLLFSPLISAAALWLLLGISMVVLGVVQMVRAFGMKPRA